MSDPSRREFLAAAAVAAVALGAEDGRLTLTVNDAVMSVRVDPRQTLLTVLRERLDVVSPSFGCHAEGCGRCTVLLDGRPVLSCSVLALEADGRSVTTAETLLDGGLLDRVARAFADAGNLEPEAALAARAVFNGLPSAKPGDVEKGLAGVCVVNPEAGRRAILDLCPAPKKKG